MALSLTIPTTPNYVTISEYQSRILFPVQFFEFLIDNNLDKNLDGDIFQGNIGNEKITTLQNSYLTWYYTGINTIFNVACLFI